MSSRQEMESKRRLVQRLAAEAEAAFARKKGAAAGEDEGLEALEPDKNLIEMLGCHVGVPIACHSSVVLGCFGTFDLGTTWWFLSGQTRATQGSEATVGVSWQNWKEEEQRDRQAEQCHGERQSQPGPRGGRTHHEFH